VISLTILPVNSAGYQLFLREDLLGVLRCERQAGVTNAIFIDFVDHLEAFEKLIQSYIDRPIGDWSWESWQGFYKHLQVEFQDLNWDYVPNPSGGFLAAWWHSERWEDCDLYLQIEQGSLCFKIGVPDKSRASEMRDRWHQEIMAAGTRLKQSLPLRRPKRFGSGGTMTVAVVDRSAWMATADDGALDMMSTIRNLRSAEQLMDLARLGANR
jgi:hypothetical protein